MDPLFLATLAGGVCLGLVAWWLGKDRRVEPSKASGESSSNSGGK